MKKILSTISFALIIVFAMGTSVFAANIKFSDVPESHWAHKTIMSMTEMGLFSGTTKPDANGVAQFAPDRIMSRAEFITVITRFMYPNEVGEKINEYQANGNTRYWYQPYWDVAVEFGLLREWELDGITNMKESMSRQEMAMVLARAMKQINYVPEKMLTKNDIPDYNMVSDSYKEYVLSCYSAGLIAGVDTAGTFLPRGVLTRAQAATVINRLTNLEPNFIESDNGKIVVEKYGVVDNYKTEAGKAAIEFVRLLAEGRYNEAYDYVYFHEDDAKYFNSEFFEGAAKFAPPRDDYQYILNVDDVNPNFSISESDMYMERIWGPLDTTWYVVEIECGYSKANNYDIKGNDNSLLPRLYMLYDEKANEYKVDLIYHFPYLGYSRYTNNEYVDYRDGIRYSIIPKEIEMPPIPNSFGTSPQYYNGFIDGEHILSIPYGYKLYVNDVELSEEYYRGMDGTNYLWAIPVINYHISEFSIVKDGESVNFKNTYHFRGNMLKDVYDIQ